MKKFAVKLKAYVWVNIVCIAAFFVCLILFINTSAVTGSISAAEVWAGDSGKSFSQIAVFFPESNKKEEGDIISLFQTVEDKLYEANVSEEGYENLYTYTYSGSGEITVNGEKGSQTVNAIGVGGEFFLFHPYKLSSGSYISEKDFMKDRIVIDKELAWGLFGSTNVSGLTVFIENVPFQVAGVIEKDKDFASEKAYTEGFGMFMSYQAFNKITGEGISSFEIVMPNVISGFAKNIIENAFDKDEAEVIENSGRYNILNIMNVAASFEERVMQKNGIIYPQWENAVRVVESRLSILFVLMVLFAVYPIITGIVISCRFISGRIKYLKRVIPEKIEERIEQKKEENYRKSGGK